MRIAYALPMTWACGGILAPFHHINELVARGHEVAAFAPAAAPVDWFRLSIPVQAMPGGDSGAFDAAVFVGNAFTWSGLIRAERRFLLIQGKDHLWAQRSERRLLLGAWSDPAFHVLAVSTWLESFVRDRCSNPNVSVIGNGVDLSRFRPSSEPRERFRLLIEGNFPDANKNVLEAVEIASRVRQHHPVEIWAFGKRFVWPGKILDRVAEDPPQAEIPRLYQGSDVLIKTSLMEGFGLPHLEAMACGCIPVTYASGGVLDFCRHERNSMVTGVGNVPMMVRNILRLTGDAALLAALRHNALQTAQSMSWGTVADRLERALAGPEP